MLHFQTPHQHAAKAARCPHDQKRQAVTNEPAEPDSTAPRKALHKGNAVEKHDKVSDG